MVKSGVVLFLRYPTPFPIWDSNPIGTNTYTREAYEPSHYHLCVFLHQPTALKTRILVTTSWRGFRHPKPLKGGGGGAFFHHAGIRQSTCPMLKTLETFHLSGSWIETFLLDDIWALLLISKQLQNYSSPIYLYQRCNFGGCSRGGGNWETLRIPARKIGVHLREDEGNHHP